MTPINGAISTDMQHELRSWSKMLHGAAADKKLAVLTNAAREAGRHIIAGRLEKITTCDWFYKTAKSLGLCDDAIQAALHSGLTGYPASPPEPTTGLDVVCLADVRARPVQWLWKNWIAIGKVSVLAGDGGKGKSTILCDLAARTSRGDRWPDGAEALNAGNVIILAAEDDVEDTLAPRLLAAGADLSRIFNIRSVRAGSEVRRSFNLQADLAQLEAEIQQRGNVQLVEIDPVTSYLGKIDSHKNADVRSVLEPLGEMAARRKVAIVCNNHFSKGSGGANSRIIGSVAFVNQARAAFTVTPDADDESRLLLIPSKMNIAPIKYGLAYRIESALVPSAAGEILTSRIAWETDPITITADQALAALENRGSMKTERIEAREYLKTTLADGPSPARETKADARELGITDKVLRNARKELGVTVSKTGMNGGWVWELPKMPTSSKVPEDAPSRARASSTEKGTFGGSGE
jgi:putative DNA primase/helicase